MSEGFQPHDFWCANCESPTNLDQHLRCARCGSDQVATRHRPAPRDARASLMNHFKRMAAEMDRVAAACEGRK